MASRHSRHGCQQSIIAIHQVAMPRHSCVTHASPRECHVAFRGDIMHARAPVRRVHSPTCPPLNHSGRP
eukprot:3009160-Pleurochrysis_carterae.AAC.1